ncbi:baculoviral IAP repeat-containing 6-like isoform X2 isoform A [Micractinium conductrix]|uniref:Baculoviral IAP repeat-containing 6-like isoform X2 isoform A n=1 Tax=Micractinium conductrix TaxID=554055 RepID=A0A2P6VEQ2_9CHLO|nr:baculoviral IAP repeat-containing 6-like isoform X2 isoform A [Micractinium conductrix]|eukprot:PSC72558.1 baculoviral IAP repeat-containing 6-like isoform X2 isoform A [Micractinium conductrix]
MCTSSDRHIRMLRRGDMALEAGLRSSAAAIGELVDSLGEESLSAVTVEGSAARFTVSGEDGEQWAFAALFAGSSLPCAATLTCAGDGVRGLAKANSKLAARTTLARAVAAAGRCVAVDLDWVCEAEGDAGSGSDEEMAEAGPMGAASDAEDGDDDELLREWSRRLVAVEKVERDIEAREASEEAQGNLDALQQRQIFDSRAAFRRLANELEEIFKAQDFNMLAEACGAPDGLYRWHVTLGGFSGDSPLAQDMREAGRRFGASSVQLQLVFKRPLHPFYPPSVQLVSPRFQGPLLSAVASHPLFSLQGWDPTRSAREALLLLKAFLEEHARVDFESERNAAGQAAAYLPVEVLLAKLEALTGTAAAAQSLEQYREMYRMREQQAASARRGGQQPGAAQAAAATSAQQQPASKKQKQSEAAAEKQTLKEAAMQKLLESKGVPSGAAVFKAGTGYGHRGADHGPVWDAKKAEAVQAARDRELGDVLAGLARELAANLGPAAAPADRADCTAAVRTSCLAPYLANQLGSASFQDMAARHTFYRSLLQCAEALCCAPTAELLSWRSEGSSRSIASAISQLETQASHFVRVYNQAAAPPGGAGGAGGSGAAAGQCVESAEDQEEHDLALFLLKVAPEVAEAAPAAARAAAPAAGGRRGGARGGAAGGGDEGQSAEEAYRLTLSQYRVRICDGVAANHKYRDTARNESMQPKLRARRVGRELASCESDLPVSASSSIFVVADETNSNLWKALITGPDSTPYAGGCFLFDIYFPPDYPRVPPKVEIRTTGGGSVRFNPNLYSDGKVCLSLLGTWQGSRGEAWSAEYSTVLQVLVSIQSLIFVDEPWYNEPGYEQRADDANSHRYSASLMPHTISWAMLDQLQHAPEYFRPIIQEHFRLRGAAILENCRRWVAWCREKEQSASARVVEQHLPALEAKIAKVRAGDEP